MQIEQVKIGDIKMYERNAKKHPAKQVEQIVKSIKEFGFNDPIAIDENNVIIEGHGRYLAGKKLNIEELPCIRLSHLSNKQKKAYILAHNKLTMNTGYNEELLSLELMDILELNNLDDLDSPINMDDFGFDMTELDKQTAEEDDYEIPDEVKTDIKQGDIFQIGEHRLMCGDSTKEEDVARLMDGKVADMCFADPPYLMGFTGNVNRDGSKSLNSEHGPILNDKMSKEEGDLFIGEIVKTIKNNVSGAFYICFYRLGLEYVFRALEKSSVRYRSVIIWNKLNHTLSNSDYKSKYEPIVYGWINKHKFYGGKGCFDIWDIKRTAKNDLHPTMKPIPLISCGINNSSTPNDIVLDPFLGSGSTMVACHQLKRRCYGMELDPKYCQVIIDRMQRLDPSIEIKKL